MRSNAIFVLNGLTKKSSSRWNAPCAWVGAAVNTAISISTFLLSKTNSLLELCSPITG